MEPLAYRLGYTSFRGLRIEVDRSTMVPRAAGLVEVALREPSRTRVHDVGTGTGAIALALKHERPDLVVTGSDVSREAVALARRNAAALGLDVEFVVADGVPAGDFDLVLANLPYVTRAQRSTLTGDVQHEPDVATVVPGDDPLEIIARVVAAARPGMRFALQHSLDLTERVHGLLRDATLVLSDDPFRAVSTGYRP